MSRARVVAPALMLVAWMTAGASAQTTATSPWTGPRTADGQPEVQGQWNKNWRGSNGANFDLEEGIDPLEVRLTGRDPSNFPRPRVVQTPDGLIPYQPWARALRSEIRRNVFNPTRPEHVDSNARCLQMGVPRQSLDNGFDLVQAAGYVYFFYPYNNAYRIIPLDGRPRLDGRILLWQGDSAGRWDGNTLIVDVRNLNDHAWYDAYGNFHSSELRLEERWVFVDANTVHYEVTSHDPKVFTRPWTARNEFTRAKEPIELWETACYEGERNLQHRLAPAGAAADRQ
jgi:hypothetical protein